MISVALMEIGGIISVIGALITIFESRLPIRVNRFKWPCLTVGLCLGVLALGVWPH